MTLDWLTHTRQLTDPQIARDSLADVDVLEELEFEPGCDGATHASALFGHRPDQAATWLVVAPCGQENQMCDGWARRHIALDLEITNCECKARHRTREFRFIPLNQTGNH